MESLTLLIIGLFSLGALFLLYSILETVAAMSMKKWAYRTGWVIIKLNDPFNLAPDRFTLNEIGATEKSKYVFTSRDNCVFRERLRFSDLVKETVNPIRGEITFTEGAAFLKGRLPLSFIGLSAALILGALTIELKIILEGGSITIFATVVICILAAVAWGYVVIVNQNQRFMVVYGELKNRVGQMDIPLQ